MGLLFSAILAITGINSVASASTEAPGSAAIPTNAVELFSTPIGTPATVHGPGIGTFVDDRAAKSIGSYSFPSSFAVDEASDAVAVLDSTRKRIAFFSTAGAYKGELLLPFNMQMIDFAWFPESQTIFFVFQTKAKIGMVKYTDDPNGKFSLATSSLFDVSKVPTMGTQPKILGISPLYLSGTSANSFALEVFGTSSAPEFTQNGPRLRGVANSSKKIAEGKIRALIGIPNGIATTSGDAALRAVRLIGIDSIGNMYASAAYISEYDQAYGSTAIFGINASGALISKTDVFPSPSMLTNRYVFISPRGSVYYMHLDSPQAIGFYKFETGALAPTAVAAAFATASSSAISSSSPISNQAFPPINPVDMFCAMSDEGIIMIFLIALAILSLTIIVGSSIILYYKKDSAAAQIVCWSIIAIVVIGGVCVIGATRYFQNSLCGTLLTFDDVSVKGGHEDEVGKDKAMPDTYAGLQWDNIWAQDVTSSKVRSGYATGLISRPIALYNSYGDEATISRKDRSFDLISAYMASAWKANVKLEVKGYRNGKLVYSTTDFIGPTRAERIQFGYTDVDKVTFDTTGGTDDPAFVDPFSNSHAQFVLDDMRVSLR